MLRSIPLVAMVAVLGLGIAAAKAGDSIRLAERGGFLLGNARRCGVATERVVKAGRTIRRLIAAIAADRRESEQAITRFAEFYLATASPGAAENALTPGCRRVIIEFEKLERHRIRVTAD
jgi:hypothetical protein